MRAQPLSASAGITLTRKGERYLAEHEPRKTKLSKRAAKAIATIRRGAAQEIERLLTLLDRIDGDVDLEDTADAEPELGWSERFGLGPHVNGTWPSIQQYAGESDEADFSDYEPSLAAPEGVHCPTHGAGLYEYVTRPGSQLRWALGNHDDLETMNGGNEDDEETDHSGCGDLAGMNEQTSGEPSLGATVDVDQRRAWRGQSDECWFVEDGETELTSTDMEDRYGRAKPTGDRFVDGEVAMPGRPAKPPMIGPRVPENSGTARSIAHRMLDAANVDVAHPLYRGRGYFNRW